MTAVPAFFAVIFPFEDAAACFCGATVFKIDLFTAAASSVFKNW